MIGPLITAAQRERCERFVAARREHGGNVGVRRRAPGRPRSRLLLRADRARPARQRQPSGTEEIFGPVIGIIGYDDLDDAVRIANDSAYGLSGQVYGADVAAATSVARRLRAGAVDVNAGVFSAYAPGGGYKQSGLGRERGPDGIREFQEVKHSIGDSR